MPTDGRRLLAAALDVAERAPSRARALALYGEGLLAFRMGARAESRQRNVAALEVARAIGDREAEALALVGISRVAFRHGDYARVRTLAGEAHELTRDLDAASHAAPLHMLAARTRLAGDRDRAVAVYTESLGLNRRLGDTRMIGIERGDRGRAAELLRRTESTLNSARVVLDPDDAFEVDRLRKGRRLHPLVRVSARPDTGPDTCQRGTGGRR